ncbi:transcriptional regulator with XRE-family HTH domain [Polynucleobacter sphagniphilus]|uniref:helix-turn-helix domain-containing protein n=1 Tax=Polynucleobacter sphagniphilus TaxID=1743169 RepID=UPI0024771B9B|nr:helix-turn-helix transcriptional regulator [Polynucleobacter sphagniphilus]MDH6240854.1 transcriptional regulator with XRE-family HTH domain [Polynucleobacter sphagniphilus]
MEKNRKISPGRPKGSVSYDAKPAIAFGKVVRARRLEMDISQEALSSLASVERSHMGKIERGEHLPNLVLILRLAQALEIKPGKLIDATEDLMGN